MENVNDAAVIGIILTIHEVLQTQPAERGIRPTGPYAIYEIDGKAYTLAYGKNGYIVSFYPSN